MIEVNADIVREFLDYDPETGVFRWKFRDRKWFPSDRSWKSWNTKYANTVAGRIANGYRSISIFKTRYYAHRLAWLYVYGEWPDNEIDHKNRIKDANNIENLREATRIQNMRNMNNYGTSEYRGVCWAVVSNKWKARIFTNNESINLGLFTNEEEAARAYDRAAIEHFGEYANLNFPIEDYLEDAA